MRTIYVIREMESVIVEILHLAALTDVHYIYKEREGRERKTIRQCI